MAWVVGIAFLIVFAIAVETFRFWTRRPLVREWADEEGLTLVEVRYQFGLLDPNWLTRFRIRVVDRTGHEVEGTAWATGWLRRKVRADWEGTPRLGHPGP